MQSISDGLIALEQNPGDLAPVETVFRGAHSLKGMAAPMGYEKTADLTHKMESLMDLVRRRELAVDERVIDLMLEATDMVHALIDDESSGTRQLDPSPVLSRVVAMTEAGAWLEQAEPGGEESPDRDDATTDTAIESGATDSYTVAVTLEDSCVLKSVRAYMVIKRLSHMGEVLDTVPSAREIEDEEFDRDFAVILESAAVGKAIEEAVLGVSEVETVRADKHVHGEPEHVAGVEASGPGSVSRPQMPKLSEAQTVRVAIGHLDNMVDLVGELVILGARLDDISEELENSRLSDAVEDYQRIVGDLQHEVVLTRMVPVGNIFNRFPRMVRDLARDLGKDLEFTMSGMNIELDRTVLDEIGDPIVHLLRNSVDHGIETADERVAAGKPAKGRIRLAAERDRDNVRVVVSDDGRGIDCDRVWLEAVERGIVEDLARDAYTDEQILHFTCVPGFSTSQEATKVSGRGVGMDVVKGKIEHLGGILEINSEPGIGSEFVLSLPLTLAIIQALLVGSGDQTFAVPLAAISEIFDSEDVKLETVDGAPVIVHRDGGVVPLYPLDALLDGEADKHRPPGKGEHIVLVDSGGRRRALHTSQLLGRREIVIKPLGSMLRGVKGLGGAAVLGDGSVALVLDPRTVFPSREETS
jgi:two-component system chemotaxis sensor kinase CheA